MRRKVIAGNWKMYTTIEEGILLAESVEKELNSVLLENKEVIVFPPALHIASIINSIGRDANIKVGAQNCHYENEGAFTGEISPKMLSGAGVEYVIIGHSERRQYFKEDNALLAKKVTALLNDGMKPVYCCGETLVERESGNHKAIVQKQIEEGLFSLNAEQCKNIMVAYEPVWAIGTGKTASAAQAQEMHAHIRSLFEAKYGKAIADDMIILYGGSVKPANASELFSQPDIDGGLVGGASLVASDFLGIISAA